MPTRLWTFVVLAAVTASAHAQLRLPSLTVPSLPQSLAQTLDQTADRDLDRLAAARQAVIERLIRGSDHRVEADPRGNPVIRGEILAENPSDATLDHARSLGFSVSREQTLDAADLRLVVLRAPANLSTRRAIDMLRTADPGGTYDYNHIYTSSTASGVGPAGDALPQPATAAAAGAQRSEVPATGPGDAAERPPIRVGLLDTGIAAAHPAFLKSELHTWGCADKQVPSLHGTAVASLLVARTAAELYAADVYCGLPTGGAVDAIIGAFAWLSAQRVGVINISLVGPKNALLERAVAALIEHGHLIVAAVGNDGPTAPPLYPAAYPQVVGVTGVDAGHRVLLEAERGPQVTFAAPGADIKAANLEGTLIDVRGTSFAAPIVAAHLAQLLRAPDRAGATDAVDSLARRAVDLGPPGKDLTYGYGLIGFDTR
jgi:subtilisin family serine protease